MMTKLANILIEYGNQNYKAGKGIVKKPQAEIARNTEQQIKDLMLEIIGDDYMPYLQPGESGREARLIADAQNALRHELWKKVEAL